VISALALNIYTVEGLVMAFELHPSKEYVFVLSNAHVSCFKLNTGECRGRVAVPAFSRYLAIDPSGLYFAIATHHTKNKREVMSMKYNG
jgi:hypothetical protein